MDRLSDLNSTDQDSNGAWLIRCETVNWIDSSFDIPLIY